MRADVRLATFFCKYGSCPVLINPSTSTISFLFIPRDSIILNNSKSEGYTNDPNPANYATSNQTLANLDTQITNYLCNIDQTYCANGPNAPVRIVRNSVPFTGEQQQDGSPTPFQIGP